MEENILTPEMEKIIKYILYSNTVEEAKNYFSIAFGKFPSWAISKLIKQTSYIDGVPDFINKNFDKIISKADEEDIPEILQNIKENKKIEEKVKTNLKLIIKKCSQPILINAIKNIKDIDGINKTIQENFDELIKKFDSNFFTFLLNEIKDIDGIDNAFIEEFDNIIRKAYKIEKSENKETSRDILIKTLNILKTVNGTDKKILDSLDRLIYFSSKLGKEEELADIVKDVRGVSKFVIENFEHMIEKYNLEFVLKMVDPNKVKTKIFDDFLFVLENTSNIFDFLQDIKDIDGASQIFEENFDSIIAEIIGFEEDYLEDEKLTSFVSTLFKEILEHENKTVDEIEYIDAGGYSFVYRIGSKIIKIGDTDRQTNEIPYHPRILQPIFRRPIKSEFVEDDTCMFIELSEEVDTNGITEEDVYKVYKELRDNGIVWSDPRPDNLGRLKRPNKIYYSNPNLRVDKDGNIIEEIDEMYIEDKTLEIKDAPKNKKILEAGELVIIDTDFIFKEDEKKIKLVDEIVISDEEVAENEVLFKKDLFIKYEVRYQEEKRAEKKSEEELE